MPQFGLIGAAVVAFGPVNGALYSWIATLASGTVTFWLGRFSGQAAVARFSGDRAKRFTQFVSRNAFAASAIVRNVPTGPFLIVNMAFGAVRANFLGYLAGMAVGIIPKILLVTFAGQSLMAVMRGSPLIAAALALAAVAVLAGFGCMRAGGARMGILLLQRSLNRLTAARRRLISPLMRKNLPLIRLTSLLLTGPWPVAAGD